MRPTVAETNQYETTTMQCIQLQGMMPLAQSTQCSALKVKCCWCKVNENTGHGGGKQEEPLELEGQAWHCAGHLMVGHRCFTLVILASRHFWKRRVSLFPFLFRKEEAVVKADQMVSPWPFRQSKAQGIRVEADRIG